MFLYFRMILVMGVSLFTSRVILDKLGIVDFGLYNVVGGIVGMLSFIKGTLSIGTSRFLTYELGTDNQKKLNRTFSTAFYAHVFLALLILAIMETGGLWFLYNKLVIPVERLVACVWTFHISIFTTIVAITQVPYSSSIMSHERMGVYAYVGIFEAAAKLLICYLISISPIDRLIFYAALVASVQLSISLFYRLYCAHYFEECRCMSVIDWSIMRSLLTFSGWNIVANLSNTLGRQGVLILINIFLASPIVAAQALAHQVSIHLLHFVDSFRSAINPQVIKLYAAGNREASRKLTLSTASYCFDLVLMLGLPAIIIMNPLMHLWLVKVPDYAVIFTQWIVVRGIIGTFSASFYTPMLAANKMKVNSMAAVYLGIGEFVLLYIVLKMGFGPMWIQYLGMVVTIMFSLIVKPYVMIKDVGYSLREIITCYYYCLKVLLLSLLMVLPVICNLSDSIAQAFLKAFLTAIAVLVSSYIFLGNVEKQKIKSVVITRYNKVFKNLQ